MKELSKLEYLDAMEWNQACLLAFPPNLTTYFLLFLTIIKMKGPQITTNYINNNQIRLEIWLVVTHNQIILYITHKKEKQYDILKV